MTRLGSAPLVCLLLAALALTGFRAAASPRETSEAAAFVPQIDALAKRSFGKATR